MTTHLDLLLEWNRVHPDKIEYLHFGLQDQLQHFSPPLRESLQSILSAAVEGVYPPPGPHAAQGISQTGSVGGVFAIGPPGKRSSVPVQVRVELFPFPNEKNAVVLAFPYVWRWSLQDRQDLEQAVRAGLRLADVSLASVLPVAYLCPRFATPRLFDPSLSVDGVVSLQVSLTLAAYGAASEQLCPGHFFFTGKVLDDLTVGDVGEVATKAKFLGEPNFSACLLVRPQANQDSIPVDVQNRVQNAGNLFHIMQIVNWQRPFDAYLRPLAEQPDIEDVVFGGVVPEDKLLPMYIQRIQNNKPVDVELAELPNGTGLALLVGDPNNGKSSFMAWSVHYLAKTSLSGSRPDPPLPVSLQLEDCFHYKRQSPKPLTWEQVLSKMIADRVKRPLHAMQGEISRIVLFLDGWDRIQDQDFFSGILRWSRASEEHPRRIILASRLGMEPNPCPRDVPVFYLADLKPEEVVGYLGRLQRQSALQLYRSLEQRDMARTSPFTNRMFLRVLSEEENISLVTITSTGALMAALMQTSLGVLLRKGFEKWKQAQPSNTHPTGLLKIASSSVLETSRFELLRPVCFFLADLQRRKTPAAFSQALIKKELRAWLQSNSLAAQDLVEYEVKATPLFDFLCDGACGLLVQQPNRTYRFRHDSFFDYCAASYLVSDHQTGISALLAQGHTSVALYLGFLLSHAHLQQSWKRCLADHSIRFLDNLDTNFVPTDHAVNMVRFFLQLVTLREDATSLVPPLTKLAVHNSFFGRLDWRSLGEQTLLLEQSISYLRENTGLTSASTDAQQRETIQHNPSAVRELAIALGLLGTALVSQDHNTQAQMAIEEAVSLSRHLCGLPVFSTDAQQMKAILHNPSAVRELALALSRMGTVLGSQGHNTQAQKAHEEEVSLKRYLCGLSESSTAAQQREAIQHNPSAVRELAIALYGLGVLQHSQSQHRQAFQYLQEAADYVRGLARLSTQSDSSTVQQRWTREPLHVQELLIVLEDLFEVCVALDEHTRVSAIHIEMAHLERWSPQDE